MKKDLLQGTICSNGLLLHILQSLATPCGINSQLVCFTVNLFAKNTKPKTVVLKIMFQLFQLGTGCM